MKFAMLNSLNRYFSLTSLIWAVCYISGALSIETKSILPENILDSLRQANASEIRQILNDTRRIMNGKAANNDRPYMVFLKLPSSNEKYNEYKTWLCGGVIVHEEFILTSAACIEDVKHFYVVAGTNKFSFYHDRFNNPCIKNGAKKAVWKCIPRNYVFDGHENDNIRWMNNDIAVVKLEDEYDFTRRIRGCDYAPKPVCYNNVTDNYEKPGIKGSIAGWGSTDKYNNWVNSRKAVATRREIDSQLLLQASVTILEKPICKKRWGSRYHNIIDNYMICTHDIASELSEICQEKYVDCTDIMSESAEGTRRNPETLGLHSSNHNYSTYRRQISNKNKDGGFCENDHGGPLIYGEGVSSIVIGIISACLVKERTNKCYGPYLYTSVYKNRVLINCAIYKDKGQDCSKLYRARFTHTEVEMSWNDHPDGPAKSEVKAKRRLEEENKLQAQVHTDNSSATTSANKGDSPLQHAGIVVRGHGDEDEKNEAFIAKVKQAIAANKTA